MKCHLCKVDKLSREFPSDTITVECEHPPYYCLRCVTNKVKVNWKCPYDKCGKSVPEGSERLKECIDLLNFMFPPIELPATDLQTELPTGSTGQQVVHVTTLTGDTKSFRFRDNMTIAEFKIQIEKEMKVAPAKQRLVYKETELEVYYPNGKEYTFADYQIKAFSTVHMMVLLCAVPEHFNHVVFDLSWTYPASGRDFLDASCYMFMKDEWYSFVDWRAKGDETSAVWHSGDKMNDTLRTGRHRIEAKLKEIPKCVSHLIFHLSSFRATTISIFPKPTLQFHEASDVNRVLEHADVTYTHNINSQALIVCCASRTKDDKWMIYKGGQQMEGNAKNQWPLEAKMREYIRLNVFPGESLAPGKSCITRMNPEEQRLFNLRCLQR